MSRSIPRVAVRGASLTLWIAGAALSGLSCRDDDIAGPTSPGAAAEAEPALATTAVLGLSFLQVSAGDGFHSCGVTTENRAYCWGQNHVGQLGDGTTTTHSTPTAVVGEHRFRQVSAGIDYTCGVTTENRAYCWGQNFYGRLGDGTTTTRLRPVAVLGGHRFRQVRAGQYHTCGVTQSDEAFCWGANHYGQLGDGSDFNRRQRPVRVAGGLRFRTVFAGGLHTCGTTTDNRGYCWGYGADGRIGDGKTVRRRTPSAVAGGLSFRQVIAGTTHSCGVTQSDRAYCWGSNEKGQLGDGTTIRRLRPVAVGGLRYRVVSPGGDHTCGVTSSSLAYCWGQNYYGELGNGQNGDGSDRLTPSAVTGDLDFKTVSSGRTHTCGVTTGSQAYCWGANTAGQLGDGTRTFSSPTPVAVAGAM